MLVNVLPIYGNHTQPQKHCMSHVYEERVNLIGEWPDVQRESVSDWLTCSSGDIERSCSLLVLVPFGESWY